MVSFIHICTQSIQKLGLKLAKSSIFPEVILGRSM